jgi:hypothetical protein
MKLKNPIPLLETINIQRRTVSIPPQHASRPA